MPGAASETSKRLEPAYSPCAAQEVKVDMPLMIRLRAEYSKDSRMAVSPVKSVAGSTEPLELYGAPNRIDLTASVF